MSRTFPWRKLTCAPLLLLACAESDRAPSDGVIAVVDSSVSPSGVSPAVPPPLMTSTPSVGSPDSGVSPETPVSPNDAEVEVNSDAAAPSLPEADAETGTYTTMDAAPGLDSSASVEDVDLLFDPTVVRRVDIQIPTEDGPPSTWDLIDEQARVQRCDAVKREYYLGAVTIDGAEFLDVGVKTKGGCGSSTSLAQKASFKLHLSWDSDPTDELCPATRRYLGKKTPDPK